MKIQCPECLTNYNINLSPEEMPGEGRKFSCQNCSSQFFVRKRQESFFISLMKNIKGKLDDWDNDIDDKALSKDKKDTLDINQQENTEESAGEINQDVNDLLNEILEEEKFKEASFSADQPHLAPETEMTAEDATHEKREKIIEKEESQQIEETLQELPEAVAEEQPPSPTEEPATAAETEGEFRGSSDQSDVDKMFVEATAQQLDGTLEEQFSPPEAQASSADSAKEDIDALWETALEEATDSDEKKQDESSTVESNKFQNDLENLLEGTDQETDASSEETNEKVEAKAEADSKTDQLPAPASPVSDDASETVVEGQEETTAMEATSSEEDVAATESELADLETLEAKDMGEETYEEDMEIEIETLSESEQEPLKEKNLFYKDMVVFFLIDKRKIVKFLIPAFITLSLISGGGYWYFSKLGDSEMTIAKVDDNETITVAKVAKKTETIEPVPAQDAKEAETTEPYSAEESKPDDRSSVVKENREMEAQKKEMKQSVIPGATYPVSKGKTGSISIGSIVPVVFRQDEIRVMSVNIKLDIDNKKVYEQVKKDFPFFEEKVESTIQKYFEGKFYRDIQFVQEKLRKELHAKLNQEVKGGEIKGVELEDFLIQ
jgi:predicted Zn finger-like uncharacterized protein